jgi:hypothetical protein
MLDEDPYKGRLTRIATKLGVKRKTVSRACVRFQIDTHPTSRRAASDSYDERVRKQHGLSSHSLRHIKDPRIQLISAAKVRAKKSGLEFDLVESDIVVPELCPVLGIPLKINLSGFKMNSPSLDRIDNTRGYTWDNVLVVSFRANSLKKDAKMDELQKIIDFYTDYKIPPARNEIDRSRKLKVKKLNDLEVQLAVDLYTKGATYRKVACVIGACESTVRSAILRSIASHDTCDTDSLIPLPIM